MSAPLIGSDGREVPVQSPEQAAELFRSGQAGYAPGTRVQIVRDGAVKSVLAEELNQALDTGARIAMREEVEQERIRRRTESGEGQAVTAVGSALNMAATLNAAPALDNAIAPEEQRGQLMERQRQFADMRELNPGMATVGDVGGAVIGAVLPGAGALTGAGALARGGAVVEAAVASRLAGRIGTGMLAKAAAKAAGRTVAGVAEGAVTGGINAFSDAAIQNKELTSEALFDSVKNDVLYGVAGNVGLGVAGDAIGAGLGKVNTTARGWLAARATAKSALGVEMPAGVAGAVADAAPPVAPKGLKDKALDLYAEHAELATGVPKETTKLFVGSGKASEAARDLLKNANEVTEAATRRGRVLLDKADDLAYEVKKGTFGQAREDLILRGAAGMDADVAAKEAFDLLSFIEAQAEEMIAQKGVWGMQAPTRRTLDDAALVRARINEALAAGGEDAAGRVASEMNQFKRRVAKHIPEDTFGFGTSDTSAVERFRQWHEGGEDFEGLKNFLEREDLFGESATMLAEINAATHQYISTQDDFSGNFLTKSGRDGFRRKHTHDPAKLANFLGNLGSASNDLVDETLTKKLAAERNFIAVAEKYIDLAETDPGLFAKSRQTADELDEYLADVRKNVAVINDGKRLQAAAAQGVGFGKVMPSAATVLQTRAVIDRAQKRFGIAVGGAAESVVRRTRRAARAGERVQQKLPVLRGSALAVAFHEKSGRVSDAVATGAASARADRLAGEYAPASAEVSAGMRANADRATSFLQSKLPPGGRGTAAFQYLKKRPVPEMEMRRFLDYVYAVENPMGVLEAVKRGDYRPEHIEALRVVYPATFAAVRDRVAAQLADLKEPPPYESRLELFRLFGIAADPSLSPEFLASMQSLSPGPVPGQNPQKPKAGSSSSRLAAMSVSQTERTLTR